jgi:hypothetical protein
MVPYTSGILAILLDEPERPVFSRLIEADPRRRVPDEPARRRIDLPAGHRHASILSPGGSAG